MKKVVIGSKSNSAYSRFQEAEYDLLLITRHIYVKIKKLLEIWSFDIATIACTQLYSLHRKFRIIFIINSLFKIEIELKLIVNSLVIKLLQN